MAFILKGIPLKPLKLIFYRKNCTCKGGREHCS